MNMDQLTNFFNRAIAPLKRRVMLMVGRSIITAIDDSKDIQQLQLKVLADEVKGQVENFQIFGFRGHPPKTSEGIMVCLGGNREHGVIIATEHRETKSLLPTLDEGDTVFYNKNGKFIHIVGDNIDSYLDKLSIRNDSHEMVAVVSEFMQKVIDSKNITAIGPQPLTPATRSTLQETKDKFDTFKV